MALPRASLTTAVLLAAGSLAPLAAQDPEPAPGGAPADPSVSVLPPRALPVPSYPTWPVSAGAPADVQSAGYAPPAEGQAAPSEASATAQGEQPEQPRTWSGQGTAPGQYSPTTGWQSTPAASPPPAALAWRWHGYGAVNPGDVSQLTNSSSQTASPATTLPMPSVAPPLPPGAQAAPATTPAALAPTSPAATEWRQPGAAPTAPAIAPPGQLPAPAPVEMPPASSVSAAAEPAWRAAGVQVAKANPMRMPPAAPEPWTAAAPRKPAVSPMAFVANQPDTRWTASGAGLAVPRPMPAGSYTPRAVSDEPTPTAAAPPANPAVRPASFTSVSPYPRATLLTAPTGVRAPPAATSPSPPPPAPPAPPAPSLAALKANIERVCQGWGRDVEVHARGPASLLVRVKVRQDGDASFLAYRISQLPELRPYQVLYEMQVMR
jgi:hypothetical protein